MSDKTLNDKRVEAVKQRLHNELVDEQGRPPEPSDVDRVVDEKAASFAEALVQQFTPLLIEHQVRDELRQHGIHRDFGNDPTPEERPES